MANVLLTTRCNRSCPYCFAKNEMAGPRGGEDFISWENLIYVADFLKSSGQRHISLLGGEPTVHPECVDFILYLLQRDFEVVVFTNGMLSPARLNEFRAHLADVPTDRLTFVCNLNDPVQTRASRTETQRIHRFLSLMGPWASAGFNIYRLDFTLDFLFDFINRYGMKRQLRLGVAHPVPGRQTGFIRTDEMDRVVSRLCSYRPKFEAFRVRPGLDCGFPICKFSDEQLGWLNRFRGPLQFGCGPAVDISPDMSVYYCFPLSNFQRKSLFEFDSLEDVDRHFSRLHGLLKAEIPGIYKDCDGCIHQEDGICAGGGFCRVLDRLLNEAPVRLPEIEHELADIRLPA
ncbi:MAG: radical SAM protein [Syntrophobacteraceae bacterium]